MAKAISLQVKALKELQGMMSRLETSLEPKDVKPVLAGALSLIEAEAARNLAANTNPSANLPEGWEHIADSLTTSEGKSSRIATAFTKVFRKLSPQAIWIEFGHRIVGHDPNKTDTGETVKPRPFFRPAIQSKKNAVKKRISDGILMLLMRASGELGVAAATWAASGRTRSGKARTWKPRKARRIFNRALRSTKRRLKGK
jgi:hypothetical protein